jgi:acyl carrier protein
LINNDNIIQVIFQAIDELNEQLPKKERLDKSVDMELFGSGGKLDSLRLVSLVTTLEQKIEENFGITVTVFDHLASSENDNPFMTVNSLADFVVSILENH